jgi:glycosyltransferase involved in cell wall biosynthesis
VRRDGNCILWRTDQVSQFRSDHKSVFEFDPQASMTSRAHLHTDVLFVVPSLEVGGTELHLASISGALAVRGWNVAVYSAAGGPVAELLKAGNVRLILPPRANRLSGTLPGSGAYGLMVTALHLLGVLLKLRPPIVHFFLPAAYLIGAPLAIVARIKLRVMSRRSLNRYQNKSHFVAPLEGRLHRWMTALLGNSRSVVKELAEEGASAGQLGLIYNGLTTAHITTASREQTRTLLGIQEATLVFVIVANLISYKGHLDLVEAFGRLAGRIPDDWKLLVVGQDGGAAAAVKSLAIERGIADKLAFLGLRKDVSALLVASDVGLLASHQEGFSNAVIEAMYAGLPMIVTDVGGNAEAVVDGETGIVAPPHDPVSFGEAIVRLARDPALRRSYGAAGRRRVEAHFSLDVCVSRYEALYRGLLAGKSPRDIPEIHNGVLTEQNISLVRKGEINPTVVDAEVGQRALD